MTLITGAINQYVGSNNSSTQGDSGMWQAAAVSALGSIGTSFLNMATSGRAARRAFNYNKQLIELQQNWQARMSNTAHRREIRDLKAAGLNPILSVTGGSGASVGGASAPGISVNDPGFENPISNALALRQQRNQNKLTESQNKLTESQTEKTNSDISVNDSVKNNYDWQDYKIQQDVNNQNLMTAKQLQVYDSQIKQINAQTANINEQTKYVKDYVGIALRNASANETNARGSYYYNTHRALGFSDSYSSSSNDSYNNGNVSIFGSSILPSKGGSSAYSVHRSRTY